MGRAIAVVLFNAGAVAIAAWIFPGISVGGDTTTDQVITLLVVGAILGVINAFIAPIIKLLSIPFIILTLGLALLVINALMLKLAAWVADQADVNFHVEGFWTAVGGALVISLVTAALEMGFMSGDRRYRYQTREMS
ncbi:MAG: phage holin family protein [Nocardioidaceae bacterium]